MLLFDPSTMKASDEKKDCKRRNMDYSIILKPWWEMFSKVGFF